MKITVSVSLCFLWVPGSDTELRKISKTSKAGAEMCIFFFHKIKFYPFIFFFQFSLTCQISAGVDCRWIDKMEERSVSCVLIITLLREGGTTFKIKHTLSCRDSVPPTQGNLSFYLGKKFLLWIFSNCSTEPAGSMGKIKGGIYWENTIYYLNINQVILPKVWKRD